MLPGLVALTDGQVLVGGRASLGPVPPEPRRRRRGGNRIPSRPPRPGYWNFRVEEVLEQVKLALAAGGGRRGRRPLCWPPAAALPRRCTTTVVIPGFRRLAGGLWS